MKVKKVQKYEIKPGANLTRAELSGANLTWANLAGADLTKANLSGADLTGADLFGADLTGADLFGANLTWANLAGADLTGADLFGADLTGANLAGAKLIGAYLDFSSWPLWCGTENVQIDERIARQLLAHAFAVCAEFCPPTPEQVEFCNKFHRIVLGEFKKIGGR